MVVVWDDFILYTQRYMKKKLLEYKGRSHFKNKVEGERRIKGEWGVQKERRVVGERVRRTPHLHSIQKD